MKKLVFVAGLLAASAGFAQTVELNGVSYETVAAETEAFSARTVQPLVVGDQVVRAGAVASEESDYARPARITGLVTVQFNDVEAFAGLVSSLNGEVIKQFATTALVKLPEGTEVAQIVETFSAKPVLSYAIDVNHREVSAR